MCGVGSCHEFGTLRQTKTWYLSGKGRWEGPLSTKFWTVCHWPLGISRFIGKQKRKTYMWSLQSINIWRGEKEKTSDRLLYFVLTQAINCCFVILFAYLVIGFSWPPPPYPFLGFPLLVCCVYSDSCFAWDIYW